MSDHSGNPRGDDVRRKVVDCYVAARVAYDRGEDGASKPDHANFLLGIDSDIRETVHADLLLVDMKDRLRVELPTAVKYQGFPNSVVEQAMTRPPIEGGIHYVLLELLGEGNFGRVWLGRDNGLQRTVAIKFLNASYAFDPKHQQGFSTEFRNVARLNHPNIVKIFHIDRLLEGEWFAVMEHISGPTLKQKLADAPPNQTETVDILRAVVRGLLHARQHGIVAHRDLKPANIILDRAGTPHIADFGIAVSEDDIRRGGIRQIGTKAYMSPEQFEPNADLQACDAWAIGVILYEMLTGKRPFIGPEFREQIQSMEVEWPHTNSRGAQIDVALSKLGRRCLAKEPGSRADLHEIEHVLDEWLRAQRSPGRVVIWPPLVSMRREFARTSSGRVIADRMEIARRDILKLGSIHAYPRLPRVVERPADLECFDIGNGHGLIVQNVGGPDRTRLFLFLGSYDAIEVWLEQHRDYRWVRRADGTIDFVRVSMNSDDLSALPALSPNYSMPQSVFETPLLQTLTPEQWKLLQLSPVAQSEIMKVTAADIDADQQLVAARIQQFCTTPGLSGTVFDLLAHAQQAEWKSLDSRIELHAQIAQIVDAENLSEVIAEPANSESFVDWPEIDDLPLDAEWDDWMLFLPDGQKKVVKALYSGPARLRGVSGSGKTCVMIHRARHLARLYQQPILVVTLTRSMQLLLDELLRSLCGAELALIRTITISSLAQEVIESQGTNDQRRRARYAEPWQEAQALDRAISALQVVPDNEPTVFRNMPDQDKRRFLREEIDYVRSRLLQKDYTTYSSTRDFERTGRKRGLGEDARRAVLQAIIAYESELFNLKCVDTEGMTQTALAALAAPNTSRSSLQRWRCVLVDEVQDLSQLELTLVAQIRTPDDLPVREADDGLFLVGDGAQTIYKKGFRLIQSGVRVQNRSFAFRKNYRNTREILSAAYGLIRGYTFADVDEENIAAPLEPECAPRRGDKPMIVRCTSVEKEIQFVVRQIQDIRNDPGAVTVRIAVLAAKESVRDQVEAALRDVNIPVIGLGQNVPLRSDGVRIGTIEKSKGHEFTHVFIPGIVAGILPLDGAVSDDDLSREAARLYVAMTRARDNLFLTYTSDATYKASRFLPPIADACEQKTWNGFFLESLRS